MMDTIMLGRADSTGNTFIGVIVGKSAIFHFTGAYIFGLASGSSVLCAQYWGKGEIKPIKDIFSFVLKIAIAVGIIFGSAVLFFPEKVMGFILTIRTL